MLSWGKKWKPGSSSTVTQGQGHTQQDPEPARVLACHHTAPSETFRLANSSGLPGAPPGPWEAGGADAVTSRGLLTGWQQACGLRSCSSFCAHSLTGPAASLHLWATACGSSSSLCVLSSEALGHRKAGGGRERKGCQQEQKPWSQDS